MLQKRDFGAEPIETPAVGEVDWNEWWPSTNEFRSTSSMRVRA
jgi:hypothetical protein